MSQNDLFGGPGEEEIIEEDVPDHGSDLMGGFGSAPVVSTSTPPVVSTSFDATPMGSFSASPSFSKAEPDEDNSAYKAWKVQHNEELEKRLQGENKARTAAREAGRAELERLLDEHRAKIQKAKATNRDSESNFVHNRDASHSQGTEWERVNGYITSKPQESGLVIGGADTTRMREVLINMKHA